MLRTVVLLLFVLTLGAVDAAPPVFTTADLRPTLSAIVRECSMPDLDAVPDRERRRLLALVRPYLHGGEDDQAALRAVIASRIAVYRACAVRVPRLVQWAIDRGVDALDHRQLVVVSRACAACDDQLVEVLSPATPSP